MKTTEFTTLAIMIVVLLCTPTLATLYQESSAAVEHLKQEHIPTTTLTPLVTQLKITTDKDLAKELHHTIMLKQNDALKAQTKLHAVSKLIQQGHEKKLSMTNTQRLFTLARTSFQREDFATALDRASQAETTANVELKQFPLKYIITYYWWAILLNIIIITLVARKSYPTIKTKLLNARINNLLLEEKNIIHLMQQTQEQHFTQKKLSTSNYHKTMYTHQHRLSTIRKQLDFLRTQRAALHGIEREQAFLKREEQHVEQLIKLAQENYFVKQTIAKTEYELHITELRERLASIEQRALFLTKLTPQRTTTQPSLKKLPPAQHVYDRKAIIESLKKTYNIPSQKEVHT